MRVMQSMKAGIVFTAVVLLASCGSSHDDNQGQVITPPSMVDQFIAFVRDLVDSPSAQAETTEPVDISRATATTPENTEPQAVKN